MAENYSENLFMAVDTIVAERLKEVSFDQTIVGKIISREKVGDEWIYQVQSDNITFKATAFDEKKEYEVNLNVYILIPGNDYTAEKKILGLKNAKDEYRTAYTNPLDAMVPYWEQEATEAIEEKDKEGLETDIPKTIYPCSGLGDFDYLGVELAFGTGGDPKDFLVYVDFLDGNGIPINSQIKLNDKYISNIIIKSTELVGNVKNLTSAFKFQHIFPFPVEVMSRITEIEKVKCTFEKRAGEQIPSSLQYAKVFFGYDKSELSKTSQVFFDTTGELEYSGQQETDRQREVYVTIVDYTPGTEDTEEEYKIYNQYIKPTKDEGIYELYLCKYYHTLQGYTKYLEEGDGILPYIPRNSGGWFDIKDSGEYYMTYYHSLGIFSGGAEEEEIKNLLSLSYTFEKDISVYVNSGGYVEGNEYEGVHNTTSSVETISNYLKSEVEQEFHKAVIYKNKTLVGVSNTLEFKNTGIEKKPNYSGTLQFALSDGSNGYYPIYDYDGNIIANYTNNTITVTVDFIGDLTWDSEVDTAVHWEWPSNCLIDHQYNINKPFDENAPYELTYYQVKPSKENGKEVIIYNGYEAGMPYANQFKFKFKNDYYNHSDSNFIECTIYRGENYFHGRLNLDLNQGFGDNGSPYNLTVEFKDSEGHSVEPIIKYRSTNQIQIIPTLKYKGSEISNSDQVTFSYEWYQEGLVELIDDKGIKYLTYDSKKTNISDHYSILKVSADYDGNIIEKFYPITLYKSKTKPLVLVEGTTSIIYNSSGRSPKYKKVPYSFSQKITTDEDNVKHKVSFFDVEKEVAYEIIISSSKVTLLPQLTKDSNEIYLHPLDKIDECPMFSVKFSQDDDIIIQPVYIGQELYDNTLVNGWNGELKVDNGTNAIFSSFMVAGTKDSANTFTGVVLGDVGANNESAVSGLYGYQDGQLRFKFTEDGEAFIGNRGGNSLEFKANGDMIIDANSFKLETDDLYFSDKPSDEGNYLLKLGDIFSCSSTWQLKLGTWSIDEHGTFSDGDFIIDPSGVTKNPYADKLGLKENDEDRNLLFQVGDFCVSMKGTAFVERLCIAGEKGLLKNEKAAPTLGYAEDMFNTLFTYHHTPYDSVGEYEFANNLNYYMAFPHSNNKDLQYAIQELARHIATKETIKPS